MDDFLKPVKTSRARKESPLIAEASSSRTTVEITDIKDVIRVLKAQPSLQAFKDCISFLVEDEPDLSNFKIPSATASQILVALIHDVVPNYWQQLIEDEIEAGFLLSLINSLRSIPGLGAIINRLKILTQSIDQKVDASQKTYIQTHSQCMLDLLERILTGEDVVKSITYDIKSSSATKTQKTLYWKELVAVLSSGRIISTVSEAEDKLKVIGEFNSGSWLASGKDFTKWLAKNIASFAVKHQGDGDSLELLNCASLLARSMSLGYPELLFQALIESLMSQFKQSIPLLQALLSKMRHFEQQTAFRHLLHIISSVTERSKKSSFKTAKAKDDDIANVATFIEEVIEDNENLADFLVQFIGEPENAASISLETIQAGISAVLDDRVRIDQLLTKSFGLFADDVFIKHSPILHQEVNAKILLLVAGIFSRKAPSRLNTMAKSSGFTNSISTHLKANSVRIRWLGMIVGTSISHMVDKEEFRMKFGDDSLKTEEATLYLNLPKADIKPLETANLERIFPRENESVTKSSKPLELWSKIHPTVSQPKAMSKPSTKNKITGPRIVEVLEDEDDDLVPYAKPDSDPEDDEEDPTLVNRNKSKAPVYIRDLLIGLRDIENYDLHSIALSTAPSLIRAKSGFGKEVIDHLQELASILMNLNDVFELENFLELRQEALIALLLAQPTVMAPHFAQAALESDFSLQQRSAILAAIGLGARELAGYKDEERTQTPSFPSKRLPAHLEQIYGESQAPLARLISSVQQSIIQPLALQAADEMTGPNALKVRTFSSRIEKDKTRKKPAANQLAKVVADGFFFPLTGRYWTYMQPRSNNSSFLTTHLLPVYLRTLALIMYAAGSWAISLPQMTSEFWTILLSIRSASLADSQYAVLEALLFSFLIVLEVNDNKERLAREHANELLETQEWTRLVMSKVDTGDEEGDKIRGLAASVIVHCQEVVDKWQRLMVGDLINY